MAPLGARLAATVAATVIVGVGAAWAKAERDRRSSKRKARATARDRKLGTRRGEPLADSLRRMALGQVDLAIEQISGAGSARSVHETRKALKRLRALVRLLGEELGERSFERENAALRDTALRLSGARDAEVMLATLDALIERHPRKLARRRGVRKLRRRLDAERRRTMRHTLGDPATLARVLVELHSFRARVLTWSLRQRPGIELVEGDLRRLYKQGRQRRRRAARNNGSDARAMHRWRKRVKDLRYAAEMLNRRDIARQADQLGELLGEDHDLAELADRLATNAKRGAHSQRPSRSTRKLLLKLIAKRRRKLQRRALRKGRRLYRASPKKFVRRISRAAD